MKQVRARRPRSSWRAGVHSWLVLAGALPLLGSSPAGGGGTAPATPSTGHPAMIDALGDTLAAGPWPRRIISLSPNLTEVLFAMGVDSQRIVGVTRYCDYPPEARSRPKIGGILDPSLEAIQMSHPDLVLAARGNPVETLHRIQALGFPVFAVDDRTGLLGIWRIIQQVTQATGSDHPDKSDSLLARIQWELSAFKAWADSIPPGERPQVYYADPEHPEWTAGPGSHVDDLIRLAGGENVVKEGGAWPQISAERLLLAGPDHLIFALPEGSRPKEVLGELIERPGWGELSLLKDPNRAESRICWIDSGKLLRPGPRVFEALEELAACLHPGRDRPVWRHRN